MVEFFWKSCSTNKKLFLPAIASVLYIIMNIIEYTTNMKDLHLLLDLYTRGISYTGIIIVPIIQKCCEKKNKKDNAEKKNSHIQKNLFCIFSFYI